MGLLFRFFTLIILSLAVAVPSWATGSLFSTLNHQPQLLEAEQVLKLDSVNRHEGRYAAYGAVADGYYVYRHSLKLTDGNGDPVEMVLSGGTTQFDEFFGDTEVYSGNQLLLLFPDDVSAPLTFHWQGCAEIGFCYPPQTMEVSTLPSSVVSGSPPPFQEKVVTPSAMSEDQQAAMKLAALGPLLGTLLFFGFGLLLAFTPCTLPMIPIVSSMVVGSQAKPARAFALTLSYVVAMAVTYAAVGVAAGLAGSNLQATLQSPWLLGSFAALFLVLAASQFGLFSLRLPSTLVNRVESASRNQKGGSLVGATALGFLSALLVGPCMTAPLAGALLYISQTGSALYGGLALFALGMGMGLPLLSIATFGARILPKAGVWMERVNIAFGYMMLGLAVMMLDRFLPSTIGLLMWGAWVLAVAIGLLAWAQAALARPRLSWSLRTGAGLIGLWALLMLVGAASGGSSVLQPLSHLAGGHAATTSASVPDYVQAKSAEDVDARVAEAGARGEWTLIDFYADWCVSCHVIENRVFGDPEVARRLDQIQVVRPDVTKNDATDQKLLKHWGVMGPPTMILVGPDGAERRDLRMVGEIGKQDFMARLDAAGAP